MTELYNCPQSKPIEQSACMRMRAGSARRLSELHCSQLDNIDHNPSSTSSRDYFHDTAVSITQHSTNGNPGIARYLQKSPEN